MNCVDPNIIVVTNCHIYRFVFVVNFSHHMKRRVSKMKNLSGYQRIDMSSLDLISGGQMISRGALYMKSGKDLGDFGRGFLYGFWH